MVDVSPDMVIEKEVLLIQEVGTRLHCLNTTICQAMLLYHHFQSLHRQNMDNFDKFAVIGAVLSLSIKKSEEDISTKNIIQEVYNLKVGENTEHTEATLKKALTILEKVQHAICENLEYFATEEKYEIAHSYVFKYLMQFKTVPNMTDHHICTLSTAVMKVLSTFYMSKMCIKYEADEIAFGCMQFIFLFSNFNKFGLRYFIRELNAVLDNLKDNRKKSKISYIVDDLILVSDVSTAIQ